MTHAYICDVIRTPFGRYAGELAAVRADDLAAIPLRALLTRNPKVDWGALDDVIYGCANQAGEDNRNVARMALLLSGLPKEVPAVTINRLCGSSLDAVAIAARAIKAGEGDLIIAGGVEGMSRAPFVMGKSAAPFGRDMKLEDTTMGWRFVNPKIKALCGVDTMPETAENVAVQFSVAREDQDVFALRSHQRAVAAINAGHLGEEITPVIVEQKKGEPKTVSRDEHPRADTSLESLARLKPVVRADGTVTAGNASGINDGAAAVLIASESAVNKHNLFPKARIVAAASAGIEPRIMGYAPVYAVQKLLARTGLAISDFDVIELNEAFAAQALAVTRALGLPDNAGHVNPNGGAIALGHPLGASGARLVTTATRELVRRGGRYALCTMCIGVGQGIALAIERA